MTRIIATLSARQLRRTAAVIPKHMSRRTGPPTTWTAERPAAAETYCELRTISKDDTAYLNSMGSAFYKYERDISEGGGGYLFRNHVAWCTYMAWLFVLAQRQPKNDAVDRVFIYYLFIYLIGDEDEGGLLNNRAAERIWRCCQAMQYKSQCNVVKWPAWGYGSSRDYRQSESAEWRMIADVINHYPACVKCVLYNFGSNRGDQTWNRHARRIGRSSCGDYTVMWRYEKRQIVARCTPLRMHCCGTEDDKCLQHCFVCAIFIQEENCSFSGRPTPTPWMTAFLGHWGGEVTTWESGEGQVLRTKTSCLAIYGEKHQILQMSRRVWITIFRLRKERTATTNELSSYGSKDSSGVPAEWRPRANDLMT